jgi:hypothetical protein
MDWIQWNQALFSIISAGLGALTLFLVQSRNAYLKNKQATENLIEVLESDLKLYQILLEESEKIESPVAATAIWSVLAGRVVELLAPSLVRDLSAAYGMIELCLKSRPIPERMIAAQERIRDALASLEQFRQSRGETLIAVNPLSHLGRKQTH